MPLQLPLNTFGDAASLLLRMGRRQPGVHVAGGQHGASLQEAILSEGLRRLWKYWSWSLDCPSLRNLEI